MQGFRGVWAMGPSRHPNPCCYVSPIIQIHCEGCTSPVPSSCLGTRAGGAACTCPAQGQLVLTAPRCGQQPPSPRKGSFHLWVVDPRVRGRLMYFRGAHGPPQHTCKGWPGAISSVPKPSGAFHGCPMSPSSDPAGQAHVSLPSQTGAPGPRWTVSASRPHPGPSRLRSPCP